MHQKFIRWLFPLLPTKALLQRPAPLPKFQASFGCMISLSIYHGSQLNDIIRDTMSKVPKIAEFVEDAKKQGGNVAIPLVVYDLPDRDCSALASNGELSIAGGGESKYKE